VFYSNRSHSQDSVREKRRRPRILTMATRMWIYVSLIFMNLLLKVVISSDKVDETHREKLENEEKIDLKHAKEKYMFKGKNS
jgi:hypothetical protein